MQVLQTSCTYTPLGAYQCPCFLVLLVRTLAQEDLQYLFHCQFPAMFVEAWQVARPLLWHTLFMWNSTGAWGMKHYTSACIRSLGHTQWEPGLTTATLLSSSLPQTLLAYFFLKFCTSWHFFKCSRKIKFCSLQQDSWHFFSADGF